MDGHLVAIEIGIECSAHQGMQLDGLAFHQDGFECLNAKAMQGGRAIQENGMFADHFLEHIPNNGLFHFHDLLGSLDGRGQTSFLKLPKDERFKEFQRHFLGQAAHVQA